MQVDLLNFGNDNYYDTAEFCRGGKRDKNLKNSKSMKFEFDF